MAAVVVFSGCSYRHGFGVGYFARWLLRFVGAEGLDFVKGAQSSALLICASLWNWSCINMRIRIDKIHLLLYNSGHNEKQMPTYGG